MTDALVSVVLPTYQRARFLPGAVASIRRQASPVEIIVVDDGSTDDTAAVLRALAGDDLHHLHQENQGPSAARNAGLAVARGEVIGFLDADDLWPPDKLAVQLPILVADPAVDIVQGPMQAMTLVGTTADGNPRFAPYARPWYTTQLGSALYRRDVFDRIGGFDPALRLSEDFDWFLRAREAGAKVVRTPEVAVYYRLHTDNLTRGVSNRHVLTTLKRSLDRRRGSVQGGVDRRRAGARQPNALGR